MGDTRASSHHRAAETFVQQVSERYGDVLDFVLLYGSVARDEQRGIDSDVDLLVVVSDAVEKADIEDRIRDLAYDIELKYGVVLSVIIRTTTEYEQQKRRPFFQQVRQDGERLYG